MSDGGRVCNSFAFLCGGGGGGQIFPSCCLSSIRRALIPLKIQRAHWLRCISSEPPLQKALRRLWDIISRGTGHAHGLLLTGSTLISTQEGRPPIQNHSVTPERPLEWIRL